MGRRQPCHPVGINNADGAFAFRDYAVTLEEKPSFTMPATVVTTAIKRDDGRRITRKERVCN